MVGYEQGLLWLHDHSSIKTYVINSVLAGMLTDNHWSGCAGRVVQTVVWNILFKHFVSDHWSLFRTWLSLLHDPLYKTCRENGSLFSQSSSSSYLPPSIDKLVARLFPPLVPQPEKPSPSPSLFVPSLITNL